HAHLIHAAVIDRRRRSWRLWSLDGQHEWNGAVQQLAPREVHERRGEGGQQNLVSSSEREVLAGEPFTPVETDSIAAHQASATSDGRAAALPDISLKPSTPALVSHNIDSLCQDTFP